MQNNQTNGIQTITQETTITENVSYTQQEYARVEAAVYKQIGITKFGPFILQSALIMAVIAVMIVSLIYTIKVTEYRQITRIETEEMTTTTSNKMIIGGSKKGETEPRTELSEEEVNSYLFEGEPIIVMSDAYLKMQETEEYIYLLDDLELKRVRKSDYAVERIMRGPLNIVVGSEERLATVYDFAVIQNDIYILVDPLMDWCHDNREYGVICFKVPEQGGMIEPLFMSFQLELRTDGTNLYCADQRNQAMGIFRPDQDLVPIFMPATGNLHAFSGFSGTENEVYYNSYTSSQTEQFVAMDFSTGKANLLLDCDQSGIPDSENCIMVGELCYLNCWDGYTTQIIEYDRSTKRSKTIVSFYEKDSFIASDGSYIYFPISENAEYARIPIGDSDYMEYVFQGPQKDGSEADTIRMMNEIYGYNVDPSIGEGYSKIDHYCGGYFYMEDASLLYNPFIDKRVSVASDVCIDVPWMITGETLVESMFSEYWLKMQNGDFINGISLR